MKHGAINPRPSRGATQPPTHTDHQTHHVNAPAAPTCINWLVQATGKGEGWWWCCCISPSPPSVSYPACTIWQSGFSVRSTTTTTHSSRTCDVDANFPHQCNIHTHTHTTRHWLRMMQQPTVLSVCVCVCMCFCNVMRLVQEGVKNI